MNVEIAERLAARRKLAGLSQEALAEKLGVSRQAVSKWERSVSQLEMVWRDTKMRSASSSWDKPSRARCSFSCSLISTTPSFPAQRDMARRSVPPKGFDTPLPQRKTPAKSFWQGL